ncbi:MAG: hypothetical protein JSS66_08010 [Armatimonadetes bacterium]|nr:hypothetical protein [Armatimonadota bacterium]
MGKVSIVSHRADLDGVASAVLASEFVLARRGTVPDQVLFADYDDAKTVIARAAIDAEELWILDLSLREPNIAEFFSHLPKSSVFFVDHHQSTSGVVSAWENRATIFFDASGNRCTADILYDSAGTVAPSFKKDAIWGQLVAATHSRDLWINNVPEGALLSDVIEVLGAQATYQVLVESPSAALEEKFPVRFQEAVTVARKRREAELKIVRNTQVELPFLGTRILFALASCYQSDLAEILLSEDADRYIVFLDLSKESASVRCRQGLIDQTSLPANKLASVFGGGGHPCAAGFPLPPQTGEIIMRSGCTSLLTVLNGFFGGQA